MNKGKNWGLLITGLVILGGGAWYIVNRARKTYQELGRREEENREILKQSGMKEEEVDHAPKPGDPDYGVDINICLPRIIFEKGYFESDIEQWHFDLDRALGYSDRDGNKVDSDEDRFPPSEHVVHIRQRFDEKSKRNLLDFIFEIPVSALPYDKEARSYKDGNTCVADFVKALRGNKDKETGKYSGGFAREMEKVISDPRNVGIPGIRSKAVVEQRVEGFYFATYKETFEDGSEPLECSAMLTIPESHYTNNQYNPDHDKVSDFVYDLLQVIKTDGPQDLVFDREDIIDGKVGDVLLGFRVTVKLRDAYHIDGINANSAISILEKIVDEFQVIGWNKGLFKYEYFMFYAPNDNDLLECYDTEDIVVIDEDGDKVNKKKVVTVNIL